MIKFWEAIEGPNLFEIKRRFVDHWNKPLSTKTVREWGDETKSGFFCCSRLRRLLNNVWCSLTDLAVFGNVLDICCTSQPEYFAEVGGSPPLLSNSMFDGSVRSYSGRWLRGWPWKGLQQWLQEVLGSQHNRFLEQKRRHRRFCLVTQKVNVLNDGKW